MLLFSPHKARMFTLSLLLILWSSSGRGGAEPSPTPRQVRRIRHWTAPDHTRVVLDMSSECRYRIRVLTKPHRIAIDIPSGRFVPRVRPIPVGDGVLDRIRINKLRSGAQVVLDLPRKTEFRHFALKPFKNRPHRIVIDLVKVLSSTELRRERERAQRIAESGDYVVILDPGHGGSQPGSVSRCGLREKDLALKLAKLTASKLNAVPGFRAVLTREGDYDIKPERRVDIVRSHGGHCFVSLHMNSHESSRPRGSEVYFLSLEGASDENAQAVAERENLFLQMENQGQQFTDDLRSIIFDLNRTNSMYRSSQLAGEIASILKKDAVLPFRGVKQANFVVLRSIAMPSILFEGAFLSNRKDVHLIRKRGLLEKLASSLARGIVQFSKRYPPSEEEPGAKDYFVHVVSRGETLWQISRRYRVSLEQLRLLNGLGKDAKIIPGQKLRVYR